MKKNSTTEAPTDFLGRRLPDKRLEPLANPPALPALADFAKPVLASTLEDSLQTDSQAMEDAASVSSGSPSSSLSTMSSVHQPPRPPMAKRTDSKTRTVGELRHKRFNSANAVSETKKDLKNRDQDAESDKIMISRPSTGRTHSARPSAAMGVSQSIGNQSREKRLASAICDRSAIDRLSRSSTRASTTPQNPSSRRSPSSCSSKTPDKSLFWRPYQERWETEQEEGKSDSGSPSGGRRGGPRLPFVEFSLDGKLGTAPEMDVRIDTLLECCWMAGVRHRSRPSLESISLAESEIYFGERIIVKECVDGWIRDSIGWLPLHFKSDPVFRVIQAVGEDTCRLPSHVPTPTGTSQDIQVDLSWILEDSFPESPSTPPGSLYLSGL